MPERHTRRAWVPAYQPVRKAGTRYVGAVVEMWSPTDCPGTRLVRSAHPSISSGAPSRSSRQRGSPRRAFSTAVSLTRTFRIGAGVPGGTAGTVGGAGVDAGSGDEAQAAATPTAPMTPARSTFRRLIMTE